MNLLERASTSTGTLATLPEAEYLLKVAVVYQDNSTRRWARQVCDRVRDLVGEDAARCRTWSLDELLTPERLAQAAAEAAQADVIVVALHAEEDLPPALHSWVEAWLPHRLQVAGALVALLGPSEAAGAEQDHVRQYLHAIACQGGLDFLVEERPRPAGLPAAVQGELLLDEDSAALLWRAETAGGHPIAPELRHWGLNE